MSTILIGGDLFPGGRNHDVLESEDATRVFGDLLPELHTADLVLANLECPLIERSTPAVKSGPVLGASVRTIAGLKSAGIHVLGLANNHIMDHGQPGLTATLKCCARNGIATVGAGFNLEEAQQIHVRRFDSLRVGILAVAESEYTIAEPDAPGANSMELAGVLRSIRRQRREFDFLIVLVHGGNEYYTFPRPGLADYCRLLLEEGARVVVCQHSHCIGCYESYPDGLILYGQGNFLFDYPVNRPGWSEGLILKLVVRANLGFEHKFIPVEQGADQLGVRLMPEAKAIRTLENLEERSRELKAGDTVLRRKWEAFCQEHRDDYMCSVLGLGGRIAHWNRRTRGLITQTLYSKRALRNVGDVIRCESHREVLITLANMRLRAERGG